MPTSSWPIEPRPGQLERAREIAYLLAEGRRVLFSAPTGWGKTLTVIAALTEVKLFPAVWFVRALAVGERIAEDASKWGLSTFIAAGRERTCLQRRVADVGDFCRYYKYRCSYFRLPPYVRAKNFAELVERGRAEGWCPYYAQDLVECDILIQNYLKCTRWLHSPKAFIVDEAHNLLLPRERTYSISRIIETIAAAKQLGASDRLLRNLESVLRYMLVRDGVIDATLYLNEEDVNELWRLHVQGLEDGVSLRPLLDLTSIAYVEGERVTVYTPQPQLPYRPVIFVSATMPPGAEQLLGAEAVVRVPWLTKPKCKVVTSVTTRFEEFDTKVVLSYRRVLVDIARDFERVLVFVPSERVARELRGVANFEECVPPPDWRGILMLRARGRFSEGVDLPADAVVIAGAPFLPPSVGEWLARQLRRIGIQDPVRAAIDLPMLITTLQCIGRAWRDPSKPPLVVLADHRFERYTAVLREFLEIE
ncbi:MAG: helicase C-terminal domain-containing protein [Thermofilaceae archaeon]